MKFSYHWIREMVPGLDTEPAGLDAPDHDEDRRVRRAGAGWRGAGREASVARVTDSGIHRREATTEIAVVETARYGD